ncbi:SDR family oxidoreductase [Akkermansiaceae bacterium]|nr:SDR family oxidoreductase [Akkermansiaceae bacterium]
MTIWITGCSSGLGRALVRRFVDGGHTVSGCARREGKISELRGEFPGNHFFSTCDVSSDDEVRDFCSEAFGRTGAPDLVINNAAMINPPAPLWEIGAKDFDRLMAINVCGTANVIRHVVPLMREEGKGMIVNMSSGWGRSTSPEVAPYCASKWAIEGLTQALAQELPEGLATVAMNPGIIDTEMLRSAFGEGASAYGNAEQWAETAAPFILSLTVADNGRAVTAP